MNELANLSPELESNIVSYEEMIFAVTDPATRGEAVATIRNLKAIREKIVSFFKDSKDHAYKAWKAICANEKTFTDRLDAIEVKAKGAVLIYDREEDKKREAERLRLQAIEDERARKERDRLLKHADSLKSEERAEALREQAEVIVAPVVQVAGPEKVNGESKRTTWKARVVDINLLPREYMIANEKALDGIAKSTKGSIKIPGVEFYPESTLILR